MNHPIGCDACLVFVGEVMCNDSFLCWMCAHMVQAHECEDSPAILAAYPGCTCTREQIFPPDVIARRDAAVRALGYPADTVEDGEIVSGELDDRSQIRNPPHNLADTFTVCTNAVDGSGQVFEQTYRRVGLHTVEVVATVVRPSNRSENISRAMRAARKNGPKSQALLVQGVLEHAGFAVRHGDGIGGKAPSGDPMGRSTTCMAIEEMNRARIAALPENERPKVESFRTLAPSDRHGRGWSQK